MKRVFALALVFSAVAMAAVAQTGPPVPPPSAASLAGEVKMTASTSSSSVTLPATYQSANVITLYNSGSEDLFFALGGASVVATTGGTCTSGGGPGPSCLLSAGTKMSIWTGQNTTIAAITSSLTTTLVIYQGNGPVQLSSVAGSGGGGGGSPGGTEGEIQFNAGGGSFGGDSGFTTNGAGVEAISGSLAIGGATIGSNALAVTGAVNINGNVIQLQGNAFIQQFANTGSDYDSLAIGQNALASYSGLGVENVCIGQDSCQWVVGASASNGAAETAVGRDALGARNCGSSGCSGGTNLTGTDNSAFGAAALTNLQGAAFQNTGLGTDSGYNLTTGGQNTFAGFAAGGDEADASTANTGSGNSAFGTGSLTSLQGAPQRNTCVGGFSCTNRTSGSDATVMGYDADEFDLTQTVTVVGSGALKGISATPITAGAHTAIGFQALEDLQGAASSDTGVGNDAGLNATTAVQSTFIGAFAGGLAGGTLTGANNSCLGYECLSSLTTTSGSDTSVGSMSCEFLGTASDDVCMGALAGAFISGGSTHNTAGANSIYIGYEAYPLADSQTNEIVVGFQAVGNGSNTVTIGNSSITGNFFTGAMTISGLVSCTGIQTSSAGLMSCVVSDARVKNDLGVIASANSNMPALHKFTYKPGYGPAGIHYGWFAQDVRKMHPELVHAGPKTKLTPDGELLFDKSDLLPLIVAKQQAEIAWLEVIAGVLAVWNLGLTVARARR